jgi:hypothetical protein
VRGEGRDREPKREERAREGRAAPGRPNEGGSSRYRIPWAELLRKVFAVDVLECPDCGGRLRVVAYLAEGKVSRGILEHLGLDPTGPPVKKVEAGPELVEPPPGYDLVDPPWLEE